MTDRKDPKEVDDMTQMQVRSESQEFGRWGRQTSLQEFGGRIPQVLPQDFGGRIPYVDQGWRSPRRTLPPSGSHVLIH